MLEHLVNRGQENDKEDVAEWLITYLGKRYDAAFTLASKALGTPVVQCLNEASVEAMGSYANINVVHQRIILMFLLITNVLNIIRWGQIAEARKVSILDL